MSLVAEEPSTIEEAAPNPQSEFEILAAEVDDALAAAKELEKDSAQAALRLKDAIEALHRPILVSFVKTLKDDPRGKELLFELVDDPGVRAILGLHGIIKADPMTRGLAALEEVRPYLQSHGGDVELVKIEGGTAYVRLQGACGGCSMSAVTLSEGVAEALKNGVAEVEKVEMLDDKPVAAFIPVSIVGRKGAADKGWVEGPSAAQIEAGVITRFDVVSSDGKDESFVATKTGHQISVFRNACVHQGKSLDAGSLVDGKLTCPWHGFEFDALNGECLNAPGAQLEQVPTRIDDGRVWVRAQGA